MVTAAPLCGQLPRSARGREACDGVPSATEGARAREHSLPLRAVYSLLVCYRPLDNIILPDERSGAAVIRANNTRKYTPVRTLPLCLAKS